MITEPELLSLLLPSYGRNINIRFLPEENECFRFWTWYVENKVKGNIKGVATHIAHQIANNKSPLFGKKLACMGKINGIPDYLVVRSDKSLGLEFKVGKNKQSYSQQLVEKWFDHEEIPYYVVRSKEEAIDVLSREGFLIKP